MRSAAIRLGRRLLLTTPSVTLPRAILPMGSTAPSSRFLSSGPTAANAIPELPDFKSDARQMDELEKEYTEALDQYKHLLDSTASPSHQEMNASLDRLRAAYTSLHYWDEAANIELERLQYIDAADDNEMAQHFHFLGIIHASQGKLIEGTKHLKQAVTLRSKVVVGRFDHALGEDLNQLAKVYYAREDFHEAASLFRQAEIHFRHDGKQHHEIMQDVREGSASDMTDGSFHRDLTHVLENQALVYRLMDNHKDCALKFEEALETIVDHEDVDRKHLLQLGLAQTIAAQGSPDRALAMYQEMLDSVESEPTANPMLRCILNGAIGESHYEAGEFAKAIQYLRTAYIMAKENGGETHPEVGKLVNLMGACQGQMGNPSEAAGYFREALFIARITAKGDETDPEVQSIAANLNMVEQALGKPSWPGQDGKS